MKRMLCVHDAHEPRSAACSFFTDALLSMPLRSTTGGKALAFLVAKVMLTAVPRANFAGAETNRAKGSRTYNWHLLPGRQLPSTAGMARVAWWSWWPTAHAACTSRRSSPLRLQRRHRVRTVTGKLLV